MRRVLFAAAIVLSMTLAGCFGPSTADWGTDSGEVEVDVQFAVREGEDRHSNYNTTTITSGLGLETKVIDNLAPVVCIDSFEDHEEQSGNSKEVYTYHGGQTHDAQGWHYPSYEPVSFTGYLAASHFYSSHSESNGASGLDFGVTTSVAIERMPFDMANNIVDGDGPRIDLKQWNSPLYPDTGSGTVELDKLDKESESSWYILGLIPTSENIQYGLTSLDEWHQAVTIYGYLIDTNSSATGYYTARQTVNQDCSIEIGSSNNERVHVLVTGIVLDGATVTSNGEASDEWVHGDVPIFGRTGYLLFFLAFGIGGAFGAFILSKMFVLQGAKSTMKTLLGKAGMESIKQVKKDVRSAKAAGLVSPADRKKEAQKHASKNKPQPAKKESSEPALAGFDLDSVLSASPSMGSTTEFGGKGSSVVETIESQEMDREISEQSSVVPSRESPFPPRKSSSSVTSQQAPRQQREHFTSAAPIKKSAPKKKKTVRKRKAAPARAEPVLPEAEPKAETRDTFEEPEEDFSDFSF